MPRGNLLGAALGTPGGQADTRLPSVQCQGRLLGSLPTLPGGRQMGRAPQKQRCVSWASRSQRREWGRWLSAFCLQFVLCWAFLCSVNPQGQPRVPRALERKRAGIEWAGLTSTFAHCIPGPTWQTQTLLSHRFPPAWSGVRSSRVQGVCGLRRVVVLLPWVVSQPRRLGPWWALPSCCHPTWPEIARQPPELLLRARQPAREAWPPWACSDLVGEGGKMRWCHCTVSLGGWIVHALGVSGPRCKVDPVPCVVGN